MTAKTQPLDLGSGTAAQIGLLLNITRQAVEELIGAGKLPTPQQRGKHNVTAAVQAYVAMLKGERAAGTKAAAENVVQIARAKEIQMRIAERERELIETTEAIAALDEIVGVVLTELNALPASITRDRVLRRQIEARVDAAQQRISDALDKGADFLRTGEEEQNDECA